MFHESYRRHAIEAAVHEKQLLEVLAALRGGGQDPILCKGWSVARLYPETGLRPYGDIDLWLPEPERERARTLLDSAGLTAPTVEVDLDAHDLEDGAGEIRARTRTVLLEGVPVRVLSPEHQLRALCLHQLRHGLWRPLWLVDVAVVVESLPPDFDWDLCLRGPRPVCGGVACVIQLAHHLLDARLDRAPEPVRGRTLPRWLVPAVLHQWPRFSSHYYDGVPLSERLLSGRGLIDAVRRRWPSPIQATVDLGAPFNEWPRLPYQLLDCAVRLGRSLARLPGQLRRWVTHRRFRERPPGS